MPLQGSIPPAEDNWPAIINAIVVAASSIGGGIAGGALVIWRAATVTKTVKDLGERMGKAEGRLDGHSAEQQRLHSENKDALAAIRVEIAELKGAIPHADDLRDMRREANEQHRLMAGQVADVSRRIDELIRRT